MQQIQASRSGSGDGLYVGAFAAILADGSVVTWGDSDSGGDSSAVQKQLKNVQQIQASAQSLPSTGRHRPEIALKKGCLALVLGPIRRIVASTNFQVFFVCCCAAAAAAAEDALHPLPGAAHQSAEPPECRLQDRDLIHLTTERQHSLSRS